MITQSKLKKELEEIINDILHQTQMSNGEIFILGCSTSEIVGGVIGKNSNKEIGEWIISTFKRILDPLGIYLAVQGCEHINRSLAVERKLAEVLQLPIVNVIPVLHAGGACSVAAYEQFDHPVQVENITADVGIDIGDTAIGMHVKHVQVPIRPIIKQLGNAHVTALYSRPKYIGGPRAQY
jgi:uncharacterized protein (TIGR01440 family)